MDEREKAWKEYYDRELVRRSDELDKEDQVGLILLIALILTLVAIVLYFFTAKDNVGCKAGGMVFGVFAIILWGQAGIPSAANFDLVKEELEEEREEYYRTGYLPSSQ